MRRETIPLHVASSEMASSGVASSGVASSGVASSGVASSGVASSGGASSGVDRNRANAPAVTNPAGKVYLEQHQFDAPPPPFRTGEAGLVWIDAEGLPATDTRVRISANSTHAMEGHGVLAQLGRLPLLGTLGRGRDVLIPQGALEPAARIIYEADRMTYGRTWEFLVYMEPGDPPIEYRVRVEKREYQRSILRLTDLFSTASRLGHAVRLRV